MKFGEELNLVVDDHEVATIHVMVVTWARGICLICMPRT